MTGRATPYRVRVERCGYWIEKDWPGHTAALSRRQCRNRTLHESGYCHVHRPLVRHA